MPKTDKELTAEIVIAYVQSWNAANSAKPMQATVIPEIIKAVYSTVASLGQ